MFKFAFIRSRSVLASFTFLAAFAPAVAAAEARLSESYGKLPLQFEQNQGQTDKSVRFLARGPGYGLYLTDNEAVLALGKPTPLALRMRLVGAAPAPRASGLEELPGKANYFVGNDPAKWRTNVPTYARVRYEQVYPGIDLVYYGNQRQLEYDFVLAPGADPKKIVLGLKGAERLEIDAQGDLVLHAGGDSVRLHKPVVYQERDGARHDVAGRYVLKRGNRVGFKVAAYDRARPLVIDPVLSYSTYLGGSRGDAGNAIAVDGTGNAYVTGRTNSTDFPTTLGAFQTQWASGFNPCGPDPVPPTDVFVTKLNATGTALIYSTYLGGHLDDSGTAIAVDAGGNVYITGWTFSRSDFPTTMGAFQPTSTAINDCFQGAFAAKLDPAGSQLIYSTFLSWLDAGNAIAVDSNGQAHVTGSTGNPSAFPTTPGAFQTSSAGASVVFVTKFNAAGSGLIYSTLLGNSSNDSGNGIAVDNAGNAYVTGSAGANFPTTPGAFQTGPSGSGGGFVTKLNPAGSALVYSTLRGNALGSAIAIDNAGNAYVTGSAGSTNFPTTPGAFQPTSAAGGPFATKLNPSGSALVYSSYLAGSTGGDFGAGIAVDANGDAFVTGGAFSADFPTTPDAQQPVSGGSADAFVTALNPTGSALIYSTYLGGNGFDHGAGIATDASGKAYVTGSTGSANFPTTAGAFQTTTDGSDAFVAQFTVAAPTRFEENAATYMGYWPTYGAETGTFSGCTIVASTQVAATATFSFMGTAVSWIGVKCNVCGVATVSIDGGVPTVVNTSGPGVPGSLYSEPVFSASGLAPDVTHTMVITVTSATTSPQALLSGGSNVAVDAFDVTR